MNAGFSNLDLLKKNLLANSLKNDLRFDPVILTLGQGVAEMFSNFCGRKFARVVGDTAILPADYRQFLLPRYPVETLTLIELKLTEAAGWVAQDATFYNTLDQSAGIVNCAADSDAGPWYAQVRFTYTGGFFWETLEPDDAAFPSALPSGATALPADLLNAWLLQCRHVWTQLDKLGTDLLKDGKATSIRFPEEFAPTVKETLNNYIRPNWV